MKLAKILTLAALLSVLPACAASTKYVSRAPVIVAPDVQLLKACDLPVDLGANPMAQAQVEKLWISDRSRLLACYRRHLALRDFIIDRDDALRGGK